MKRRQKKKCNMYVKLQPGMTAFPVLIFSYNNFDIFIKIPNCMLNLLFIALSFYHKLIQVINSRNKRQAVTST